MNDKTVHLHVVDDEKDLQTIFKLIYKKEIASKNLEISFSTSGKECLDYFAQPASPVDFLLTDINMPEMNGIDLIKKLNSLYPEIHIYVASAYDSDQYKEQLKELNIDGFLTKPIDFTKLKNILNV